MPSEQRPLVALMEDTSSAVLPEEHETASRADDARPASETRDSSPSPSLVPSRALDGVPHLDRSVSTPSASTVSSLSTSTRSRESRLSDGGTTAIRRRGYMRPLGTAFADSARNRDSVMNLGTISHLQYYFSRTGLLDGKGGQLAKETERVRNMGGRENTDPHIVTSDELAMASFAWLDGTSNYAVSDPGQDASYVESPSDMQDGSINWNTPFDPPMLPPTVSTYKQKMAYIEPLPDLPVLRRELKEALQDACKMLEESQKDHGVEPTVNGEANGFYEIQGLHLLDIITLAIRAAKNYYTAHSDPQKLYAIRSEKILRSDLYQVLDILKRMASRNFRGGMRLTELTGIIIWIESIDQLLKKEELAEQLEAAERETWQWRDGDWTGRERRREWLFLKSFDKSTTPLPDWPEPSEATELPNAFLLALQDGQRLVQLHNTLIAKSKQRFNEIKTWHVNVSKPYRMSENLLYWIKAAELRWEIKLTVPVSDVVNGKSEHAWRLFEEAIFTWSQGVRAELMEEWRIDALVTEKRKPPEVKVDTPPPDETPVVESVETTADTLSPSPQDVDTAASLVSDTATQPLDSSIPKIFPEPLLPPIVGSTEKDDKAAPLNGSHNDTSTATVTAADGISQETKTEVLETQK